MASAKPSSRPTRVRYGVLGMTVAVYMITYMDRVVISNAAPSIRSELGLSLVAMGWILASFRWSYALFQIPGGWLGDRIGPRRALALIVTWWSIFTSATAMAWNATSMTAVRFLFGVGEAGAFPIATRSLSRWLLPGERGFAQGLTHAGSRLGAALTPPLVVAIIARYGWRAAFYTFGTLGLIWSAAWFAWYRDTPAEHAAVNAAERELIESGSQDHRSIGAALTWRRVFSHSTVWTLCAAYFCYTYALATYLDWLPTYLKEYRRYSLAQMGFYAMLPLLAGTTGDFLGGWLADLRLRRTGKLNSRRAVAIAGFLAGAVFIIPATLTSSPGLCVFFTCLAFFGIELTVGVSWAIPLDIAGDRAGSVSSLMNMCGNIGGAISPIVLAYVVKSYGWNIPFLITAALCALGAGLYCVIDLERKVAS
jgi:MFS transporter, ACS family, glucarate transporter